MLGCQRVSTKAAVDRLLCAIGYCTLWEKCPPKNIGIIKEKRTRNWIKGYKLNQADRTFAH